MITMTLDNIYRHLEKKGFHPTKQEETQQVYCLLSIAGKEYPLFFRIYEASHLLQLLAFIPSPLTKEIAGDMARLLHLLNKELDLPGFGMDELAGVIFYRVMIPIPQNKLEESVLDAFLNTFNQVCSTFSVPIQAIGSGAASLDDLLSKASEKKGY